MDKDRSILTQVAAKIAADLTTREGSAEGKVSEFAAIFDDVKDILTEAVYGTAAPAPVQASQPVNEAQMVQAVFPQATEVSTLQVVGQQHGDLPDWLISACRSNGTRRVYDNRDGLAQNPKRPWFKDADNKEKAFWPPRGN